MLIKIPYKLELKNCYDILKNCFGIDNSKKEKITDLQYVIIDEPKKEVKRRHCGSPYKSGMVDALTKTDSHIEIISPSETRDFVFVE